MRAIARSRNPNMPMEAFPLHFERCENVLNIPLVHNSDDSLTLGAEADHDYGHVVLAATLVGEIDEPVGG